MLKKGHVVKSAMNTLYIPLYAKAYLSSRQLFIHDPKAEEIWAVNGTDLIGKAKSKWIAYYTGMRVAVIDRWTQRQVLQYPDAIAVQISCGMDSRNERIGRAASHWYDVDFPEVIEERRKYFQDTDQYRMIAGDAATTGWLDQLPDAQTAIVVMDAVYMYLPRTDFERLGIALATKYPHVHLILDTYSDWLVRASNRYAKHPVRQVGSELVSGMDNPTEMGERIGIPFVHAINMTPPTLVKQLPWLDRMLFRTLFTLNFSKQLYRMYMFSK